MGANLTVLSDIKDLALKNRNIGGREKERTFQINPVDENNTELDALR
jgi:hypothetical protein